jgi:hypothetical protein
MMDFFVIRALQERSQLPLLFELRADDSFILEDLTNIRNEIDRHLLLSGGILFRGLQLNDAKAFRHFVSGFNLPLLPYDFASTPRTTVGEGVYTSTEYPASQHIPLHNEQSYSRNWAMRLWFYCMTVATAGGETPIADSREIYGRIDKRIRERFIDRKLMYVRNYGNGLDLPWQKVFGTQSKQEVVAYCEGHGISWEWKADGELRTRQICEGVASHPVTGDTVWFNQAHLFHISALEPTVRAALIDAVGYEDLPRNVYYGDGGEIELGLLDEVRTALQESSISFSWQEGDVLMIDNMLTAHGRAPFKGDRRVLVAMADPYPGEMKNFAC